MLSGPSVGFPEFSVVSATIIVAHRAGRGSIFVTILKRWDLFSFKEYIPWSNKNLIWAKLNGGFLNKLARNVLKKLFLGKKYKLFILEKSLLRLSVAEENSASDSYMERICIFITFWVITKNIFYKLFINFNHFYKKILSMVSRLFKCSQDFKIFLRKGLICQFLKSKFVQNFQRLYFQRKK